MQIEWNKFLITHFKIDKSRLETWKVAASSFLFPTFFYLLFQRENNSVDLLNEKLKTFKLCLQTTQELSEWCKRERLFIMISQAMNEDTAIVPGLITAALRRGKNEKLFFTWLKALIAFVSLNAPQ